MRHVAFMIVALCALSSLAPPAAAQILLNEFLADPASDWDGDGVVDSKRDEWVEVVNVGPAPVDLSTYRLTDESAGTDWRYAFSGTLAPGELLVVMGSEVVAWQTANGVSAFGLSLNNGGDTVYLYEEAGGVVTLVDSQAYGSGETADDRSLGRFPNGTGGWVVFDGLNPYTGSAFDATGCNPSPGSGPECPTPVEESSWGRVKYQYQ